MSAVLSDLDAAAIDLALTRAARDKARDRATRAMRRFLDPKLFFQSVPCASADEAIDFLCGQLESQDIVRPGFRESVLLRESYSPTAFAHRFAVPHSMEFLGKSTRLAVLVPTAPIPWGGVDVSLVLMLALNADDYDDFMFFYQSLISLFYERRLFSEIRKAADFNEFVEILVDKLPAQGEQRSDAED